MLETFRTFARPTRRNEKGASAVEYGLLVALIAAVIVVAVFALGQLINHTFSNTCNDIQSNNNTATGSSNSDCPNN